MRKDILFEKCTTLVRRQRLELGETTRWHVDPYVRITVVLHGDPLEIEYRDDRERERSSVRPGQGNWDEPTDRRYRA